MKNKKNTLIQTGILVALGLATLLSIILPQIPDVRQAAPMLEISVILRDSDSTLWSNVRLGMEQAAGELGAELRFLTLATANSPDEQEELIGREAEGGADGLIVVSADPEQLSDRRKELLGQIPLLAMESEIAGAALTVAPDNRAVGEQLARAALEDWSGGTILLLDTGAGSTGVAQRLDGAEQVLLQAGVPVQRRIVAAETLGSVLAAFLQETGAVQVMGFEPAATERLVEARAMLNFTQPAYGVGMTSAIAAALERGNLSAVVAWSDYAAGYLAAEGAVRAARGLAVQAEVLPFFLLRGEDVYDSDNQKLLFPVTS